MMILMNMMITTDYRMRIRFDGDDDLSGNYFFVSSSGLLRITWWGGGGWDEGITHEKRTSKTSFNRNIVGQTSWTESIDVTRIEWRDEYNSSHQKTVSVNRFEDSGFRLWLSSSKRSPFYTLVPTSDPHRLFSFIRVDTSSARIWKWLHNIKIYWWEWWCEVPSKRVADVLDNHLSVSWC